MDGRWKQSESLFCGFPVHQWRPFCKNQTPAKTGINYHQGGRLSRSTWGVCRGQLYNRLDCCTIHQLDFLSQFVWCAFEGVIRHVIKRIQKTIEEAFTIISFSNNVNDILLLQYFDICQTQSGKLNGYNLVSGAGH